MRSSLLLISVFSALSAGASAQTFGNASNFSLFASGNVNVRNAETAGRAAVGGNFTSNEYYVGSKLTGKASDALVVGGSINAKNTGVRGTATYGGTATVSGTSITTQKGSLLDFAAISSDLKNRSNTWSALGTNGSFKNQYGGLYLTGTNSGLNVFTLDAKDLTNIWGLNLKVPTGSSVLINVKGTAVNMGTLGYTGFTSAQTLWNFSGANTLNMKNLTGTLLAPYAALSSEGSGISGQAFVASYSGSTTIHGGAFGGSLAYTPQAVPEPASMFALGLGGLALLRRRRNVRN